mgnify:FL=1
MDKTILQYDGDFMPGEIFDIEVSNVATEMASVEDSNLVFDEDANVKTTPVPGRKGMTYVNFGEDNQLPFNIIKMIGIDEVMSQNKLFNVITCYGAGLKYMDVDTRQPTTHPEIKRWLIHNSLPLFQLEQATDMKYSFFCVSVIILSRDGKRINRLIHKEACYCRFQQARRGKINHVIYANFRENASLRPEDYEVIRLLDPRDPLGDLMVLMGREPGRDGETRVRTEDRKFAILVRFPTPGFQYYPIPYYTSIFRGDWYDIKRLIGKGKKAKLRNHASVKYQVEVHKDYWSNICAEEHITDPLKKMERIKKEKENIKNFVSGIENSGKVWITGYYIDPNGREVRMVRINVVETGKEGGDWSEDIQEASNITCYGDNIHPNLVGATPGKGQSNNSGSDKRELFTLKQALEIPFHDLMNIPHNIVIEYNGWSEKVYPDVPMVLLTTLDQNTDAKQKTASDLENKS